VPLQIIFKMAFQFKGKHYKFVFRIQTSGRFSWTW